LSFQTKQSEEVPVLFCRSLCLGTVAEYCFVCFLLQSFLADEKQLFQEIKFASFWILCALGSFEMINYCDVTL